MQTLKPILSYHCDIMLVDDDIDEHMLFKSSLGDLGLNKTIMCFDSGKKAIEYLDTLTRSDFPSLIVLDYCMPKMNGEEMLKYLKYSYRFSYIPVIIYSGEMDQGLKWDLIDLGAQACFKKSEDMKQLKTFLEMMATMYSE